MWSKIDGTIAHHPKLIAAGPIASWYYVCGLTYASTYGTDGLIPEVEATHLTPLDDPHAAIKSLVAAGLWHRCKGGYQIHDFLDYQPTAARMKAGRAAARRRSAEYRARRAENVTNGAENASRHASRHVTNARSEVEVEVEVESKNAPLPPTPAPSEPPEARAPEPRPIRPAPKPRDVERAQVEEHPLYPPLVGVFGNVTTGTITSWNTLLHDLDELGARPEDVPRAAAGFERSMGTFPDGRPVPLTRESLVKHWYRSLHAPAPMAPPRALADARMPTNGGLDNDKYLTGEYARFFNRSDDDEKSLDELEREMGIHRDDGPSQAAAP